MQRVLHIFSTWIAVAVLTFACGQGSAQPSIPADARCAMCGMVVEPDNGWRAGGQSVAGAALSFDAPKCMFRHHHERGVVREPWVIEYYSQERRPAEGLFYVLGTDLEGPMGRDLVPVATREEGERMMRDHHGTRVLTFAEVTRPIVASLFGGH